MTTKALLIDRVLKVDPEESPSFSPKLFSLPVIGHEKRDFVSKGIFKVTVHHHRMMHLVAYIADNNREAHLKAALYLRNLLFEAFNILLSGNLYSS